MNDDAGWDKLADRSVEVWNFMRHMKIVNQTAERLVKESRGLTPST